MADTAIIISSVALAITFIFSLGSLILSWKTFSARFKPKIAMTWAFLDGILVKPILTFKNIGNGPATRIIVTLIHSKGKDELYVPSLSKDSKVTIDYTDKLGKTIELLETQIQYKDITGKKIKQKHEKSVMYGQIVKK